MELAKKLESLAVECGAFQAVCIPTGQIILDTQFRQICKNNSCGRYGRCYQCPPDIGEVTELMERVRSYTFAVFYQSVMAIEDSFDFEGMMEAAKEHSLLSQRIEEKLENLIPSGYLHLSSGCRLCERCAKVDDLPCRYPEKALPAVEGYGVDVYQTVKNTRLKYNNGQNTVTYFGAILY